MKMTGPRSPLARTLPRGWRGAARVRAAPANRAARIWFGPLAGMLALVLLAGSAMAYGVSAQKGRSAEDAPADASKR
jgi:hypothetical protein